MPIYEYQCIQCGERFEIRQAIGEGNSGLSCPKCHAPNPRRIFSSFFSGDLWKRSMRSKLPTCDAGSCGFPGLDE
jgi:putative FmdB family regulatory protein